MTKAQQSGLIRRGEGRHFSFPAGNAGDVKADSASGLRFGVLRTTLPAGTGMPFLHVHREIDEAFQVLAGSLDYVVGAEELTARAGDAVLVPHGVPHCFRALEAETELLLLAAPAEAIDMIVELSAPACVIRATSPRSSPATTQSCSNSNPTGSNSP
jgi:quercetin dioxygenase-like cupin family protein